MKRPSIRELLSCAFLASKAEQLNRKSRFSKETLFSLNGKTAFSSSEPLPLLSYLST